METLTSLHNPLIKRMASLKEKKGRANEQLFLIEGIRFVEEALKAASIEQALVSDRLPATERGRALYTELIQADIPVQAVSDKVLAHVSDTENPQGIAAAIKLPSHTLDELLPALLVVVDGVQDPGNLGTIVRSSLASGASGVICTKGTVDLYNPKTLRSTMGAIFRLPVVQGVEPAELIEWVKGKDIPMVVADAHGEDVYYDISLVPPCALLIGSEGEGPNTLFLQKAGKRVRIPLRGGVESLNAAVAASLLLFESSRQQASKAPLL